MPRRLNNEDVRQKFIAAGYIPDNEFQYRNNKQKHRVYDILNDKYVYVSLQSLNYNIKKGHRPLWEAPGTSSSQPEQVHPSNDPLTRFIRNHNIPISDPDVQQATFNYYKDLRRKLARQKDFEYAFVQSSITGQSSTDQMRAVILALQDSMPKLLSQGIIIRLKMTTTSGLERYFHVNPTTLNDLWLIFKDIEPDFSVEDSSGNFALNNLDIATIQFTFKQKAGQAQVAAGFFPFINTTNIDLSRYGIYTGVSSPEPCILTAFKASAVFNDQELNQLQEMINTRLFPQQSLKPIADHFNINIYVRKYHENGKSSHVEFTPELRPATRSIRLMIMHSHYMLYEKNYSLIKNLIKDGSLRPFTSKEYEQAFAQLTTTAELHPSYNAARPIVIRPPTPRSRWQALQGKHFFGYDPGDEVDFRLNELQRFVNTLPLRNKVNVRHYFKFSKLFLRIMFEFGCFDNVYELAGDLRNSIRNSLTFPNRVLTTEHIDEKCYYLDFNGAYCSFMQSIPTGPTADGPANTKIKELIQIFYNKRIEAKQQGNTKFATTLKFMMCSCYGTSIAKPQLVKHKYSENIEGTIRNQGEFVISHENKTAGFVNIIQPYVEHYSHPHFAKVILDGFNTKLNEIKSIVNVLFINIDAIVVNEHDYNKLLELGYVHPTELGCLKVEHVFSSMTFYNKMRWIGVNLDGTEFRHCC